VAHSLRYLQTTGCSLCIHLRDSEFLDTLQRDDVNGSRRFLIQSQVINEGREEKQMTLLCLSYLSFESLDANIARETMRRHLMDGDYTFLEYATLHWNHHLESTVQFVVKDDLLGSADLGIALNQIFEIFQPGFTRDDKEKKEYEKASKNYMQRCATLESSDCFHEIISLLSHAKASRLCREQLDGLGPPGTTIKEVRMMLEELSLPQALELSGKQKLKDYFGDKLHKCPHHACYYFHEGFLQASSLLQHTNKHEKPFCCTELGCTRMYIGWSTEKELKKHMNRYHPDPNTFAWKFPAVKKVPAVFQCDLCPKQFTRANILSTHRLRAHLKGEKLDHVCEQCGKGFVRNYELVRHQSTHP
jgi:hypothetical protein